MATRANPWNGRRLPNPVPSIPLAVISILAIAAIFAPNLAPYGPAEAVLADGLLPPAWVEGGMPHHILGTDLFGRDILSRIIHGARVSLTIAALVILIGGGIGTLLGMCAGYYEGWAETLIMRAADIVMSFPLILMAIVLAVVFGASFANIVLVISFLIWPLIARQVRGETLGIKRQDYVSYSIAMGLPTWIVMIRHILPNVVPTLIVVTTLEVGHVILLEATLSFLGAGIPPPDPSWGLMVSDGRSLFAYAWWVWLFAGLAILATVLAFNMLGDWLRDHFDPRLRRR